MILIFLTFLEITLNLFILRESFELNFLQSLLSNHFIILANDPFDVFSKPIDILQLLLKLLQLRNHNFYYISLLDFLKQNVYLFFVSITVKQEVVWGLECLLRL